jgi:hypothetical protein
MKKKQQDTPLAITPPISAEIDPPESFAVTDEASANWVVRKIIGARAYARHVKEWARRELRRAEREEEFFLHAYGRQLEDWAQAQIAQGRRKSIKLPAGTVGYRADPPRLDVLDDRKLIEWCRSSLPTALKIETHILKQHIKDHFTITGEIPDGVTITEGGQRFYVR